MKLIYLDNAAATKADNNVVKAMLPYLSERYANPSSQHFFGRQVKQDIEQARSIIAKSIKAQPKEIIFTSGGTEANNLALKGLFFANPGKRHIITSKIEHDSILKVCKWLESKGAEITYLDVDTHGFIKLEELEKAIRPETLVVSIVHANNEIGTIQNIKEIGKICKRKKVYFHTDACQSYLKIEINVIRQNMDLVTINAHKIHGPKGIGALYVRKGVKIEPVIHGGGHESGLRSGTENTASIMGFAEVVKSTKISDAKNISALKDYTIGKLKTIEKLKLNGPGGKDRLCNNINISLGDIEGESIQGYLEEYGIMISTGSACASHSLEKSHVLKAIGLNDLETNSSIRISLSKYTTKKELDYFVTKLKIVVERLRALSPFAS